MSMAYFKRRHKKVAQGGNVKVAPEVVANEKSVAKETTKKKDK